MTSFGADATLLGMRLALAIALTSALGADAAPELAPARAPGGATTRDAAAPDASGLDAFTTANGTRGLQRVETAESGPPGELVLSASGELFAAGEFLVPGDSDRFVAGHLTLSVSPRDRLALWTSWSAASNSNDRLAPRSTSHTGDPALGAKLRIPVTPVLDTAVMLSVMVPTSAGGRGLAPESAVLEGRAIVSRTLARGVVVAGNAGYVLDRSGELLDGDVTAAERFAAGVYGSSSVFLGAGAQASRELGPGLVAGGFAEVTGNLARGGGRIVSPIRATVGLRALVPGATAWEVVVGADLRLAGAPRLDSALPGIPSWQLLLRAAGHFGGSARADGAGVEPSGPGTFELRGTVVAARTGAAVPDARVTVSGLQGELAIDPRTGAFEVGPIPVDGGLVQIQARASGYAPATQTLPKGPAGGVRNVTMELVPLATAPSAVLKGIVIDARTGKPVRATVSIQGGKEKVRAAPDGSFTIRLEAGRHDVTISDPAHVPQARTIELTPGGVVILNVDMLPRT